MLESPGHYKILDRTGTGGIGEIYRAGDSVPIGTDLQPPWRLNCDRWQPFSTCAAAQPNHRRWRWRDQGAVWSGLWR
jgi:hypothetical protein